VPISKALSNVFALKSYKILHMKSNYFLLIYKRIQIAGTNTKE
jgi:hypothetical protein